MECLFEWLQLRGAYTPVYIHEPHLMPSEEQRYYACRVGRDYPEPIIDHRQARLEYLEVAKQSRKDR